MIIPHLSDFMSPPKLNCELSIPAGPEQQLLDQSDRISEDTR